jgi:hypothetical protein
LLFHISDKRKNEREKERKREREKERKREREKERKREREYVCETHNDRKYVSGCKEKKQN